MQGWSVFRLPLPEFPCARLRSLIEAALAYHRVADCDEIAYEALKAVCDLCVFFVGEQR